MNLIQETQKKLEEVQETERRIYEDALESGSPISQRQRGRLADLREEADRLQQSIRIRTHDQYREEAARSLRLPDSGSSERRELWHGQRSFFGDLFAATRGDSHAQALIASHDDLRREELSRSGVRALTTSGAGALVPRIDDVASFSQFPTSGAPTWTYLEPRPLPESGFDIQVPRLDAVITTAGQSAQGSAVATSTPAIGTATAQLVTFAGSFRASQQFLERATPEADLLLLDGLRESYYASVESSLLNGAGGAAALDGLMAQGTATVTHVTVGTADVTNAASYTAKFAEAISELQGSAFSGDSVFVMHPRRWASLMKLTDDQKRPLLPILAGSTGQAPNLTATYGASVGSIFGVPVITSGGAATDYSTDQDRVLLMARGAVAAWQEAAFPTRVMIEPDAGKLEQILTVYGFVAAAIVRPQKLVILSGAGLSDPFA
jgi:HK97 family phage major capsid protein